MGLRSLIVLMFSLGHVCFTYTTVAYHMYIFYVKVACSLYEYFFSFCFLKT